MTGGKGKGKAKGASASFSRVSDKSTPKSQRGSNGHDSDTEVIDLDPNQLVDSILTCLTRDDKLLDNFISHLFEVPNIQDKLVQKVVEAIKYSETHSSAVSGTVSESALTVTESGEPTGALVITVKELLQLFTS